VLFGVPGMRRLQPLSRKARQSRGRPEIPMTKPWIIPCAVAIGLIIGLSACTNPYDPIQRMIGGGLIGAGSGAAIGAAAAGGHGAALGAAVGGAVGAITGLITTPPPAYRGYYNHRHYAYHRRRYYGSYSHRHYASYSGRSHHCAECGQTGSSTATISDSPSGL
jgi:hypothetical protein